MLRGLSAHKRRLLIWELSPRRYLGIPKLMNVSGPLSNGSLLIINGLTSLLILMGTGLMTNPLAAQQVSISVSSGSTTPGSSVTLSVSANSTGGAQSAALQWTMSYSASDISGVTVVADSATTAAGKTLSCSNTTGATTCVVFGVNATALGNGSVARATFTIAPGTT